MQAVSVSLTSICCKILESFIRDHTMSYLWKSYLLHRKQYGFIKGRSSMLQLLHMLDKWTEYLDYGGQIDAVYTDFEKAFDKVPHKRLLSKLCSYGINGNIINWIKDFLAGRKYRVKVNSSYSSWADVTSGIPQGSVLGPLRFVIYINDVIDCCEPFSNIYLFADDAKLFHHVLHPGDQQLLQKGIDELVQWTQRWLLNLNTKNV